MKELYSYQEIQTWIRNGQAVTFLSPLRVQVTAAQKHHDTTAIHVTYVLLIGEDALAEFVSEFETMEDLLNAFDIADHQELFELLADE